MSHINKRQEEYNRIFIEGIPYVNNSKIIDVEKGSNEKKQNGFVWIPTTFLREWITGVRCGMMKTARSLN